MPKANDSEVLAHDLAAAKHGLILLNPLPGQPLAAEIFHMVHSVNDAARSEQHAAQDELLDGVGIGAGRVENGNAELCHARDGDVVGAGAAAGYGSDGVRDLLLLELVRAEQDGMGVGCVLSVLSNIVFVLIETLKAIGTDLIEALDLELARRVAVRSPYVFHSPRPCSIETSAAKVRTEPRPRAGREDGAVEPRTRGRTAARRTAAKTVAFIMLAKRAML